MSEQQQFIIAELNARTAMAFIELEAMRVANRESDQKGEPPKYTSKDFMILRDSIASDYDNAGDRFRNSY